MSDHADQFQIVQQTFQIKTQQEENAREELQRLVTSDQQQEFLRAQAESLKAPVQDQIVLGEIRKEVGKNMPPDYRQTAQDLLKSEKFWGDSRQMQRVKNMLRKVEDVLKTSGKRQYTVEDVDQLLKHYNDAIYACNAYVNNTHKNKTNDRYRLVSENLLHLADEAAMLDKARKLIKGGKWDSRAESFIELISRARSAQLFENKRDRVGQPKDKDAIYVRSIRKKYDFGKVAVYGKSTDASLAFKNRLLDAFPQNMDTLDEETKAGYELIRKWASQDLLNCKTAEEIRLSNTAERESAKELYAAIKKLKQSQDKNLASMAGDIEVMQSGQLEVDLNDRHLKDISSDEFEGYFSETFYGHKMRKKWEVELKDRSQEPLFTHEPNIADIKQGNVGDCYFLAGLATLLEQDPDFIKRSMRDLGDKVAVRFENFGKPRTVIVKKTTLSRKSDGKAVGAVGDVLWVQIMEKAYAAIVNERVKGVNGYQMVGIVQEKDQHEARLKGPVGAYIPLAHFELVNSGNPYNALDCGGDMGRFLEAFAGRKFNWSTLTSDFHYKSVSFDEIAKTSRKEMAADLSKTGQVIENATTALYEQFDRSIKQFVTTYYSRTKVKSYSEYAGALEDLKKQIKKDKWKFDDQPEHKDSFINYIDDLLKYAKRNNKILHVDHSLIGAGAYKDSEIDMFEKLEKAEHNKKIVDITFRHEHKFEKKDQKTGKVEHISGGFASSHQYTFVGTRRVNEGGMDRLFIMLRNPWADMVRAYDKNAVAMAEYNTTEEKEKVRQIGEGEDAYMGYDAHVDTNGVFNMELRDFLNMAEGFKVER